MKLIEKKNRYQLLFEEGKKRIESLVKQSKYPESNECTFNPNMELTKSFNQKEFKHIRRARVTERKIIKPDIYRNSSLDSSLNLNKRQLIKSQSEAINIGDKLHSIEKQKEKRRQRQIERQEKEIHKIQNSRFVLSKSKQMFNSMKLNCFHDIFSAFDCEGKGEISYNYICTEGKYIEEIF